MLFKLAWRNLWRQKRRTLLTASALSLALILSLAMRSLQEGTYASNIDNSARFYTGLIQLQHIDFSNSHSIDDLLPASRDFIAPVVNEPKITDVIPRLESFALAAAEDKSKGVMVLGIDPVKEDQYSGLSEKITQGDYLTSGEAQVLVGASLARTMKLTLGDELVLYGQGFRGQTAAGLYTVKGIISFPLPQLESQLVYLPLGEAQQLFSTGEQVTNWVLHTDKLSDVEDVVEQLKAIYPESVSVQDWQQLSPETAQQIQMDKVGGIFLMYILYGVVGFGLFATIMMMTLERQREFGVMLATGMQRGRLLLLVSIESLLIAMLGIVIGMLVVTPVLTYLLYHPIQLTGETAKLMVDAGFEPILPVMMAPSLYLNQIAIVLLMLVLCLIYPMIRIGRLNLVNALKGGAHAG
ncbi:ABC transporter permease [Vibrio sinaloensis]|uniref:ABC transporter permease n=1 Tax=Photobacterium sp. (strain ATCC 43367) TaxID=379097 RepID=UPI0022AE6267|nr:ABC transporter permease [Vibrio sinaloensis]MCZ4294686.1 ABC transporter permease [Vibrio sinaloensis]